MTHTPQRRDEIAAIIRSAAESLFDDDGYHATKIEHVAAASGFSVGTIYNYFASKEDLFLSSLPSLLDSIGATDGLRRSRSRHLDEAIALLAGPAPLDLSNDTAGRIAAAIVAFGKRRGDWSVLMSEIIGERMASALTANIVQERAA